MPVTQLKLPAYGRELLRKRERGAHPLFVKLIYGDEWGRRDPKVPRVCVDEGYAPGMYDWHVLAGVAVEIVWRSGERICELAAEVAQVAVPVTIYHTVPDEWARGDKVDIVTFLYANRDHPELARLWSRQAQEDYQARESAYYRAALADAGITNEDGANGGRTSTA